MSFPFSFHFLFSILIKAGCDRHNLFIFSRFMWRRYLRGLAYFTGANILLTLFAAVLCVCFAPTAAGPGIPEVKAYLNGVDTPNMFGLTTLIVKVC